MSSTEDSTGDNAVPKGSLVEIIDGRNPDRNRNLGPNMELLRVTSLDDLYDVLDKFDRWWSLCSKTTGWASCEPEYPVRDIDERVFGIYLGSLNVYDGQLYGSQMIEVYRAILLEKSVYIIPSNSVKWVQGVTEPKKAASK